MPYDEFPKAATCEVDEILWHTGSLNDEKGPELGPFSVQRAFQ